MTKYIDAEKLKAEIERLYDGEAPRHDQQCDFDDGYFTGIGAISQFIDTLEEPIPADLEEAAGLWYEKCQFSKSTWWNEGEEMKLTDSRETFIAGAKWQKEQDTKDMFMSDNRHFNKVYELGKNDMKEQMLNDAVEGEVYKFGEVAYVKERNNTELTKYLSQFNNGDKVKIIVIHETDIR